MYAGGAFAPPIIQKKIRSVLIIYSNTSDANEMKILESEYTICPYVLGD